MLGTIIFFVGLIGVAGLVAKSCSHPQTPAQKERELEEIDRQQKTFWRGQL